MMVKHKCRKILKLSNKTAKFVIKDAGVINGRVHRMLYSVCAIFQPYKSGKTRLKSIFHVKLFCFWNTRNIFRRLKKNFLYEYLFQNRIWKGIGKGVRPRERV